MQQLIALTRPKEAKAAGIPVETTDQLRWLERTADAKGLRAAFVRVGKRVYLDPEKFHELVRHPRPQAADAAAIAGTPTPATPEESRPK